jgi:hypothetical protein
VEKLRDEQRVAARERWVKSGLETYSRPLRNPAIHRIVSVYLADPPVAEKKPDDLFHSTLKDIFLRRAQDT